MTDGFRSRNQRHHIKTIRHAKQISDQGKDTYYVEDSQPFIMLRKLIRVKHWEE